MKQFKIFNVEDQNWDTLVNSALKFDFHHTASFHKLETKKGGEPLLFVAEWNREFIAFPLIIRNIPNSNYFDATSVYGYCGPISSQPFENISPELISFFQNKFLEYCIEKSIVSVFARLHPLIETKPLFDHFGEIKDLNKTVAIDLSLPIDEQRKLYRKSNKSEINQLKKKKGYYCKILNANHQEGLETFVEIYHETMKRVAAKEDYFFDMEYFKELLRNQSFKSEIILAVQNEIIAAGAVFTESNFVMQYHLAGTRNEYIKDTPMKLIIDEARLRGTEKNLKYLHLGGGVAGSDEDSLFKFKSGFSNTYFQFSVLNLIIDAVKYDELIQSNNIDNLKSGFFPLYRDKL